MCKAYTAFHAAMNDDSALRASCIHSEPVMDDLSKILYEAACPFDQVHLYEENVEG